jgi:hypothetical protein
VDQVSGEYVLQLHIELNDVEPTVWRRVLVPGDSLLSEVAETLLVAMGWQNSHLHQIEVGDSLYGMQADDDSDEEEIDEATVTAIDVLRGQRSFTLVYDLGDNWEHRVTVEEITWTDPLMYCAVCLGGEQACPPEDSGGPGGYRRFLDALADPGHPEHRQYSDWIGGAFDPAAFSVAGANALLQEI